MNPNPEQLKAIEHNGGVLLKAGAGSGKTFVLVEHIIYLLQQVIDESGSDLAQFRSGLRIKLKQTVLMTFTNKAAAEIKIRLKKKVADQKQDQFWDIINQEIDILKTTTIHGFFYSLIKDGLIANVAQDLSIVNEGRTLFKIKSIFEYWLTTQDSSRDLVKILSIRKDVFFNSFAKIFLDPALRLDWEQANDTSFKKIFDTAVCKLCELLELNDLFGSSIDLSEYQEHKKKKWFEFVEKFNQAGLKKIESMEDLNTAFSFIADGVARRPLRKNGFLAMDDFYDQMASLKDLSKKLAESLKLILNGDDDIVNEWYQLFTDAFEVCNKDYFNDRHISFSDIEYLIAKATKDPGFIKLVSTRYKYFIIDEFQDTSEIQYEILKTLALNDFNRFFCIGDIKQAIYGFRGGEIGVFLDLEQQIPMTLSMSNNYRSASSIINFNNDFFKSTLATGIGFEGEDLNQIEFEDQNTPDPENQGQVLSLKSELNLEAGTKLKSHELDLFESDIIFKKIKEIYGDSNEIAVLYKKLKPSGSLIKKLIKENLSFTAQVKLPLSHDPIIGIFKVFIMRFLEEKEQDPFYLFMINNYLKLLNKEEQKELVWDQWISQKNFYPINYIFTVFLNHLGLSTSQYKQSLNSVEEAIINSGDDLEVLYRYLENSSSENYSFHFKYGQNPEKIQLMTTHASKGLEFEHVFVAGIYSNGPSMSNKEMIGNCPGSFKFHPPSEIKKSYPTPSYLLENKMRELKDFSESKRLLYVACTRAKQALYWTDLDFGAEKISINKNSWINAFSKLKAELAIPEEIINSDNNALQINTEVAVPLFHHIDFGITNKSAQELMIMSELSVTRLTTLIECPRMFYFANILKIKSEELDYLGKNQKSEYLDDEPTDFTQTIKSSSTRGTEVHGMIEHALAHNFVLPRETTSEKETLTWTLDYLKTYQDDHLFISEKMIKFELLGYMISGIPDLILKNTADGKSQIIDYKTGRLKEEQNEHYWMQLMCYAYYLFSNDGSQKEIILKLLYVDEKKVVERIVSYSEVLKNVEKMFSLINKPNLINQDSCHHCAYGNICQRP